MSRPREIRKADPQAAATVPARAVIQASAHGMDAYIPAAVTGHIPYAARKGPVPPHGSGFLGLVAIMLAGYSRENDRLLIHPSL